MKGQPGALFVYEGFDNPNGTIVPDDFFDVLAPQLGEAELRVLIYLIRRTFGFKKNEDNVSLSQMVGGITTRDGRVLDLGTGMAKSAVVRGIHGLVEKGIVITLHNTGPIKGHQATTYALRFKGAPLSVNPPLSSKRTSPLVLEKDKGSPLKGQALVLQEDTQQTVVQTTEEQTTVPGPVSKPGGTVVEPAKNAGRPITRSPARLPSPPKPLPRDEGIARAAPPPPPAPPSPPVVSPTPYLDFVITDLSRGDLRDPDHINSNVTQARNLMVEAGITDEEEMVSKVYRAIGGTKKGVGIENRGAYFFRLLRDGLGLAPRGQRDGPEPERAAS